MKFGDVPAGQNVADPSTWGGGAGGIAFRELVFIASPQTAQAWTNQPAALTELFGNVFGRKRFDLTGFSQFRLACSQSVAGAANAKLRARYSTDGNTWADLETGATTADLTVGAGTGLKTGAWANIAAAAKVDAQLRIDGIDGDAVADPAWRQLVIQVK